MSIAQANKLRELEDRIMQLEARLEAIANPPKRPRRTPAEMEAARNSQAA